MVAFEEKNVISEELYSFIITVAHLLEMHFLSSQGRASPYSFYKKEFIFDFQKSSTYFWGIFHMNVPMKWCLKILLNLKWLKGHIHLEN